MSSQPKPSAATLSLADKVRAVAIEGMTYAQNPYDKQRYESLLEIATGPFADALELDFKKLLNEFRKEVGSITPKLGTDAAVMNDKGQLLILRREDGEGWCLPC